MTFKGWPDAALDFYVGLEADNSKAYWQSHTRDLRRVREGAVSRARRRSSSASSDRCTCSDPNRDTRFSKDKTPYKTAAAAVTESEGGAAYYVQISAEGLYVGSGYYHLESDQLQRFRDAVADTRTGPKLASRGRRAAQEASTRSAARHSLKRAPRGIDPDHPRVELLRMKGIHVGRPFGSPRWLHTRGRVERIVDAWRDAGAGQPLARPQRRPEHAGAARTRLITHPACESAPERRVVARVRP